MIRNFNVQVRVPGNPVFATVVPAIDEWKARTRAMIEYPYKLRGQLATFIVEVL